METLALLLPPALVVALWLYVRRRYRAAARLGDPAVLRRLDGADLTTPPWLRLALVLAAGLALSAVLAKAPAEAAGAAIRGGPVVLVLDVSGSMLAQDVEPSRLELERDIAREAVRALTGTPTGLVVFAGRAFVLSPPTLDPGALELYLDALDPSIVTQGGSSLAAAIRQAASLLSADRTGTPGTILLVSDGDAPDPLTEIDEAARLAASLDVRILAVGVGTERGATVPDVDLASGRVRGLLREPDGRVAVSRLRKELLRAAAEHTGGSFVDGTDPRAVERLLDALREPNADTGARAREAGTGASWPAGFVAAALLLLVADAFLATTARGGA